MDSNPLNPGEAKPPAPKSRGPRRRNDVIEFEFAQETVVPLEPVPVLREAPRETSEAPEAESASPSATERVDPTPISSVTSSQPTSSSSTPPKDTMSNPPIKPNTITDFKRNVDQQKKEQKSFGNVLATITYSLLIGLILVTGLAGYGAYQFWLRLNDQATTIAALDQKYDADVTGINEDLKRSREEIEKINGQLARQQEQVSMLRASLDKAVSDARTDRLAHVRDVAALQKRIADLENRGNR